MKRRNFIKNTSLASGMIMVPSFIKAFDKVMLQSTGYKRLVVIQLSGGNDGLNTLVPFRNDIYYNSRPRLAVPQSNIIKLTDEIGIPKNLIPLKRLYDQGYLSIINKVGYPNPDRSHFRSMDIWHTASNSNQYWASGWIGRFLDSKGNKPHNAVEIDEDLSMALHGERLNGIATNNAKRLYDTARHPYFKDLINHYDDQHLSEHNLGYLYKTLIEAESSAHYIYETTKTTRSTQHYTGHPFGKQLKTTAEFINSGLDTKVFYTSMAGYDTHANQKKTQPRLLEVFAKNLEAFVQDLDRHNTFKDTLILTFSEFGRRVKQNAANGTDHGAANALFVVGKNLRTPGFYNSASDLTNLDSNGDIRYEIDFREVYATILNKWLEVDDEAILRGNYRLLDFV